MALEVKFAAHNTTSKMEKQYKLINKIHLK